MGTPEFAIPTLKELLKEKLNIIHVYTQPPKKSNRGLKIEKTPVHLEAEKNNLKVHHPSSLKNEIRSPRAKFQFESLIRSRKI